MTTIKQSFIKHLPPDVAKKAITNVIKQKRKEYLTRESEGIWNDLLFSFFWDETQEGRNFWNHTHNGLSSEYKPPQSIQTRNDSFKNLEDISEKQRKVYNAIKRLKTASDSRIAKFLNWPINCVTGRRNELVTAGLIEFAAKKYNPDTNRSVCTWRVKV